MTTLQILVQIGLFGKIPNFGTLLLDLGLSRELHTIFLEQFFKADLI